MKVTLYMAVSADGFIAKVNDAAPWSDCVWEEYVKTVKDFGNIIVGRRTYELMVEENEFSNLGNPFTLVFTNSKFDEVETVNNPKSAIEKLKEEGFERAYLGGGAQTNGAFLKAGLIDEIILDIESFVFGEGIPLFSGEDLPELRLDLIEAKQLGPQTVRVHYKVIS